MRPGKRCLLPLALALLVLLPSTSLLEPEAAWAGRPQRAAARRQQQDVVRRPATTPAETSAHRRTTGKRSESAGQRLRRRAKSAIPTLRRTVRRAMPTRDSQLRNNLRVGRFRDRAALLDSPADALMARLDLLKGAKDSVKLSTYILEDDRLGRLTMARLRDAALNGKKVQLLVDANGKKVPDEALAELLDAGVEIGIYNPLKKKSIAGLQQYNYRMHDKLAIADDAQLIIGGRNSAEGYFGSQKKGVLRYVDVEAQVRGEGAGRASRYFDEIFASEHVVKLSRGDLKVDEAKRGEYAHRLHRADKLGLRLLDRSHQTSRKSTRLRDVEFVHQDTANLRNSKQSVHRKLVEMLDSAHQSVEILTPYLVPSAELMDALGRARARGVAVRIVTNSRETAHSTDKLVHLAFEADMHRIAQTGVEVWEYRGAETMHAKVTVVDGKRFYIGSFNQDPRSQHLNKEVGLIATSKRVSQGLNEFGESLRQRSVRTIYAGRVTPARGDIAPRSRELAARYIVGPVLRVIGARDYL